jgi:hypothetical protein
LITLTAPKHFNIKASSRVDLAFIPNKSWATAALLLFYWRFGYFSHHTLSFWHVLLTAKKLVIEIIENIFH